MASLPEVTDADLAQQLAYYSARAPEYDDWWHRRGRFDEGPEANAAWLAEVDQVVQVLDGAGISGDVLELAAGTGTWSMHLARRARRLTVVDGAAATLARNPVVGRPHVHSVVADLFTWEPDRQYDAVSFTFWVSHVPRERLDDFFARVGRGLKPGGRVFFADDRASATDGPHVLHAQGQLMKRSLDDGTSAIIVKNFYEPEVLVAAADRGGIDLTVGSTPRYFTYGFGSRRTD